MEFSFQYVRQQGEKHTYHVKALLSKHIETEKFAYSAVIHRGVVYVGPAARWPLQSNDADTAIKEAKSFIEADIENLVGISE